MKNLLPLLLIATFLLGNQHEGYAQSFLTTWTVAAGETITIPTNGVYTYSYDIDWENDGTWDVVGATGNETSPPYPTAGDYQVAIQGTFPAIHFNDEGDKLKISSIDQWGAIAWAYMGRAFQGCSNLGYTATDAPDLTAVTDMSLMFHSASAFNGDISNWNTSSVTNMYGMFGAAGSFNRNLNTWNVSSVTDMGYMFWYAGSFNGDISNWNTSSVTNMTRMFRAASAFNGDLINWNVSSVTNMSYMFQGASTFNGDLSNWNTWNVTDMSHMFENASAFNSDVMYWNTASVTDMSYMFHNASSFNGLLDYWELYDVTNMASMLDNCGMSIANYDNTLIGWMFQPVPLNITLGANGLKYCEENARNTLIISRGWTIVGDSKVAESLPTPDVCTSFSAVITPGTGWTDIVDGDRNRVVSINAPTGVDLGTVTVEYQSNTTVLTKGNTAGDILKLLPRHFHLSSSNFPNSALFPANVGIRFYFTDAELAAMNAANMGTNGSTTHTTADLSMTHYSGSNEDCDYANNNTLPSDENVLLTPTAISVNCQENTLEVSVMHFSEFVPHEPSATALPLEFIAFDAKRQGETVLLTWKTANEVNNKGFDIERSFNGRDFGNIGFVAGAGTTIEENQYTFQDKNLEKGIHYYRLKQMDFDGTYEYSKVIQVKVDEERMILGEVYPNPSGLSMAFVDMTLEKKSKIHIEVFDTRGKLIQSQNLDLSSGEHQIKVDHSSWIPGLYIVQFNNEGHIEQRKLVIE